MLGLLSGINVSESLFNKNSNCCDSNSCEVSRSYFAIASSFMMRLLITSTSQDEVNTLNDLVRRWRWAMRIAGGNSGSQLMSLGLLRLDRNLLKSGIQVS